MGVIKIIGDGMERKSGQHESNLFCKFMTPTVNNKLKTCRFSIFEHKRSGMLLLINSQIVDTFFLVTLGLEQQQYVLLK